MNKTPAIICDIDGTLAHRGDRDPFDYSRVGEDIVDFPVKSIIDKFYHDHWIILLSGRDEVCRKQTESWLVFNNILYHDLFMREEKDNRKDSIVKEEIFSKHIKEKYQIHFVLDDRNQVVDMWRSIGLKCLQVQPGDF